MSKRKKAIQEHTLFDADAIKRIEDELQVVLPQAYRELLLSHPFADDPDPYEWEMMSQVDTIIADNRHYRNKGFFGAPWPSNYLIIGGDGCGNLYFLQLSRADDVVFFADHDATSEEDGIDMYEDAPNLAEWIAQIREEKARAEAEEERYAGGT